MLLNFLLSYSSFTNNLTLFLKGTFLGDFEHSLNINITNNYLLFGFIGYILIYSIYSKNQNSDIFITKYISTPIHELMHLIGAFIVGAKIYEIKLWGTRQDLNKGVLGYIKTDGPLTFGPLGNIFNNFRLLHKILQFILQPIISLGPIIFGSIFYIISLLIILQIPLDNIQSIFISLNELKSINLIQTVLLYIITIIYLLSSIPSQGTNGGDLNNIKYQLFVIFILSFVIINPTIILIEKCFFLYIIVLIILHLGLLLINRITKR